MTTTAAWTSTSGTCGRRRVSGSPHYSSFRPTRPQAEIQSYRRHAKGNSLFANRGDGTFEEVGAQADVELGRWAWSSDFFDFDNDGHEDLYVVNGFITNEDTKDL